MANVKQKLLTDKEASNATKSMPVGGVPGLIFDVRKSDEKLSKAFLLS